MTDIPPAIELAKELVREGRSGDAGVLAKALLALHEEIEKAPVVHGRQADCWWFAGEQAHMDTHRARIIKIEKL